MAREIDARTDVKNTKNPAEIMSLPPTDASSRPKDVVSFPPFLAQIEATLAESKTKELPEVKRKKRIDDRETRQDLRDASKQYQKDIFEQNRQLLTREQEVFLSKRIRAARAGEKWSRRKFNLAVKHNNSTEADLWQKKEQAFKARFLEEKKDLVESNLRFVRSEARIKVGRGLPFADLVQEGNIGLMQAAEKYKGSKGFRFSTYARFGIRRQMDNAVNNQARGIRVPKDVNAFISKVMSIYESLVQEQKRIPSLKEWAEAADTNPDLLQQIINVSKVVSLSEAVGPEMENERGDFIPTRDQTPDELASQSILSDEMAVLLQELQEKDQFILKKRHGEEWTFDKIGQELGISRERVRQRHEVAMKKLQNNEKVKELQRWLKD